MTKTDYFERRLDDKHRLTLPVDLRDEFDGGEVVLTRGFKNYLHLYSKSVWEQKMEPALTGNILDEELADKNVQFRTGKVVATMDRKQGRITLEKHLLEYANIEQEVVVVRAGEYFRIMPKI